MKRSALLVLAVVAIAACPKPKPAVVDAGPQPEDVVKEDTKIKPTFDVNTPADPRATELCKALYALPEEKKVACCNTRPGAAMGLAETCAGALSDALKGKNIVFDEGKAKQCEAERAKALDGCSWVLTSTPLAPPVCAQILSGTLDQGARCRSSLECKNGLRCQGAGPINKGRCEQPLPDGSRCALSVDGLSIVIDQVSIDAQHPPCKGVCGHFKCEAVSSAGGPCQTDVECAASDHCDDATKKCVGGHIALGDACKGSRCVDGAVCVKGTCRALAKEGEACDGDVECGVGGCAYHKGQPHGVCGMKCSPIPL